MRRPVQASDGRSHSPISPTLVAHAGDLTAQGTALPPSRGLGSADFLLKASILIHVSRFLRSETVVVVIDTA